MLVHAQVCSFGFNRHSIQRLFDEKVLWRIVRGVYSLGPDPTWLGLAWGGVLLGGPAAALGFEAAGHLHGLCDPPRHLDVLVPRRMADRGPWRFHQMSATNTGAPSRTSIEVTALQLCGQRNVDGVISVLTRAVGSRRTTAARLLESVRTMPYTGHRALIQEVLSDVDQGVHSALEARFARDVERRHGLPAGTRQPRLQPGSYADVFYGQFDLIVELDGMLGHTLDGVWRDFRRDNLNVATGRATLRFGWHDVVGSPCDVALLLARVLRQRGWLAQLRRCHNCR